MSSRTVMLVVLVAGAITAAAWAEGEAFAGRDLTGAQFTDCTLQGALFERCTFSQARLLYITNSPGLSLRNCKFATPKLEYVTLSDVAAQRSTVDGLDAYDLTAEDWEIEQSQLTKITFESSYLRYLTLDHC